jgi:hypothetical protein
MTDFEVRAIHDALQAIKVASPDGDYKDLVCNTSQLVHEYLEREYPNIKFDIPCGCDTPRRWLRFVESIRDKYKMLDGEAQRDALLNQ